MVRLDIKWLLIRHYIESKNPREDQYSVNHSFGVGDHLFNEHTIAGITSPHITQLGEYLFSKMPLLGDVVYS